MFEKISVIGAGGWGTTLAVLLAEKGHNVSLWVREKELADIIKKEKENKWFLPGVKIPDNLNVGNSLKDVAGNADLIVVAVPTQFLRNCARDFSKFIRKDVIVVSVVKGLEISSHKRASQILEEELGNVRLVALSGPNHCEEVSRKIPTATVIASKDASILEKVKETFSTDYFKVYPHNDVVGVEICGAIKNIAAIAVGVCDGLGLGDNAKGSLITLGLAEMNKFGRHFGAKQNTCYGLAGVGDLVATCISRHSRNRLAGELIAKGKTSGEIKEIMHGMVAEGIETCKAVYEFSKKHNIDLPLTTQVYKVLYENKVLKTAINDLISLI